MSKSLKQPCSPVQTTLDVIGGKWKPLILWNLRSETLRFSALNKRIAGITQKMLTQQLRELEHDELIIRKIYPQIPPKVEYSITDYGKTLYPVLNSMCQWGESHEKRTTANGKNISVPAFFKTQ